MPKEVRGQKRTIGRVMHEFKHGELKRSRAGKGGKVKSRNQAVAIALSEAGESRYDSARKKRAKYRKTKAKERAGNAATARRKSVRSAAGSTSRGVKKVVGNRTRARKATARTRSSGR